MTYPLLVAAALAIAVVLGFVVLRSRREIAELRRRLDASASQLQNLQVSFSRFAPDTIIDRILRDGDKVKGERVEVSVLFADLVGFTALSEQVEPDVLVRILNGYFERMSDAITSNRGHVSTFIGDGMLAFFGALAPNPWQSDDAVRAAMAMRDALDAYNLELRDQGLPALRIGIGMHRGSGIAGLVGSRDFMEFTIVGRTVNVAARVQDLTRRLGADVIVTEDLREKLAPHFALRPLPDAEVKGVSQPLRIHSVEGIRR